MTLLSKKNNYKLNFNVDIIGFEIGSDFVVGYGLDFDQRFRNFDSLYRFLIVGFVAKKSQDGRKSPVPSVECKATFCPFLNKPRAKFRLSIDKL